MSEPDTPEPAAIEDWITLGEAAKIHPHLSEEWIRGWMDRGLMTKQEEPVRIWLKQKKLGGRVYTRAQDITDFLAALEPDAPAELVERFRP